MAGPVIEKGYVRIQDGLIMETGPMESNSTLKDQCGQGAVSYTHLTLPTILLV